MLFKMAKVFLIRFRKLVITCIKQFTFSTPPCRKLIMLLIIRLHSVTFGQVEKIYNYLSKREKIHNNPFLFYNIFTINIMFHFVL